MVIGTDYPYDMGYYKPVDFVQGAKLTRAQKDAIIGGNDQMGIAAMKLMAGRGLQVPSDVAITGFNAFEFWQYTVPVLTSVRSPAYEMGARGGAEILKRLGSGRFDKPEIIYSVALQRGGST